MTGLFDGLDTEDPEAEVATVTQDGVRGRAKRKDTGILDLDITIGEM